jgi:glycosyltransferase involved in cell wall biosynthesis
VHCFAGEDDAPGKSVLRTSLFHRAVTEADALVVPSRFVADYFRDIRGPGSQVHVIPNGITLDTGVKQARERPLEGPLHLASLGALTPHKGAHVVVEALRMASPLSARYTLFGGITQPYTCELREVAKRVEGLEMRIYGPYEPASLPALLADVHALIIPSVVWETFSIVAREAMCCGVPVIASRLGALPEAVREGENGLLFTAGSSSELAVLLRSLDADRMRLDRMRSGIRSTDWISVSERTSRLEALLEEVWAVGVRQTTTDAEREETEALRALLAN